MLVAYDSKQNTISLILLQDDNIAKLTNFESLKTSLES